MIEFVDTHTHLFTTEFDMDRSEVVQRSIDAGVSTLCLPAINEESLDALLAMCETFPGICHPMIGLHPTELGDDYGAVLDRMYALLKSDDRFIAIGEVGLTGEIRSVSHMNQRLQENARLGFKKVIIPKFGSEKLEVPDGLTVYRVRNLQEAIATAL